MKRKISLILCFTMILNAFFININAVTDEKSNFQETTAEVSVENTSEISSELFPSGETSPEPTYELDKDDISDAGIDKVLEHEGLLGLSKKQYVQYLMKHYKNADFEEDQALMEYTGTTAEFTEKYIKENSKIIAIEKYSTENNYVVYFKGKSQNLVINMIRKLAKDDKVIHIQPNFRYYPCAIPKSYSYNFATTRAYEMIEAPGAWDYATGKGVKVGVIDTGVNSTFFKYNQTLSHKYGGHSAGVCTNSDCKHNQHGTMVASVIGKNVTTNESFVGLAYDCEIVSYGVLEKDESWRTSGITSAIKQANSDGIKILNGSFGWNNSDPNASDYANFQLDYNIREAIKNYNGLFIQASGNESHNDDLCADRNEYKNLPNLIIVGAVDESDNLTYYSDYGTESVHIAAPGNLSVFNRNGKAAEEWGTSFSAPLVSATAALMLQVNPSLTPSQLKTNILNSADTVPQLEGKIQGARRLNVKKAVKSVVTDASKLRIAALDNNGTLKVKEGAYNSGWSITDTGVSDFQLEGKKLGIIQGGKLKIKEGALNSYWDLVAENVKSFKMKGNIICVLYNDDTLRVFEKNGSAYTQLMWESNISHFDIEGRRIGRIRKNGTVSNTAVIDYPYTIYDYTQLHKPYARSIWMKGSNIQVISDKYDNEVVPFAYFLYYGGNTDTDIFTKDNVKAHSCTLNRIMLATNDNKLHVYKDFVETEFNLSPKAVKAEKYKMYHISTDDNVLYYQSGAVSSTWTPIKWYVSSLYPADGYTGVITTDGTFSIIPDNGTWQVMSTNVKKAQILF